MVKVLHVLSSLSSDGGVQNLLKNYYTYMDKDRIKFDFAVYEKAGELEPIFEAWGCRVFHITPKKTNLRRSIIELDDVIKKGEYDIIHCHQGYKGFITMLLAKKNKINVRIIHNHTADLPLSGKALIQKRLMSLIVKHYSTHWFACGIRAAKWLYGDKAYKDGKVYIIKNAIDTRKFMFNKNTRETVRRDLKIDNKQLVFGHIGRFTDSKNHEFLIEVFAELYKQNKNVVLLLAGGGELLNDVKQKVSNLAFKNNIKFLGRRDDIPELLQAMDIFLFPSKFEGLAVVLIEAQCTGIKCLASDTIPNEVKITDNLDFVPINNGIEPWVKKVESIGSYLRYDATDRAIEAGYEIKQQAKELQDIYLSIKK